MSDAQTNAATPKPIWQSKTLYINLIAMCAPTIAQRFGVTITAEDQVYILGIVNIVLRIITKQPVSWSAGS